MGNDLYEACKKYMRAGYYGKAYDCVVGLYKENPLEWYKVVVAFRKSMKSLIEHEVDVESNYELLRQSYCLTGKDVFDDFMIAAEWYRKPDERFWLVRREQLLPVCEALQMLANDELDELFISLPPRIGKTTLILFYVIWTILRNPNSSTLYCSYTDLVVKTFYDGVMEILEDPLTYDVADVFPGYKIAGTDAKARTLNVGRRKHYPSLTARSVDGSLNGSCDVSDGGIIIGDDLHSGIDEARSKDQLIKKWETVRANFLSRAKGSSKRLWIGTRWSLIDCIGNRLNMLESDPDCSHIRYRVFNIPALNEDGESNFDYKYKKGFSTLDYKVIRASYEQAGDTALWLAPYMGTPIEREGAVFVPNEMRYYNGELPKEDPDRILVVVDPAWGGGDYVAAVAAYQYDEEYYIPEVVFDAGDKYVTIPQICDLVMRHNAGAVYIEGTRVTANYADEVDKRLRAQGYRVNLQTTTKNWAGNRGKSQRICDKAPEIRERVVFLDKTHQNAVYSKFMQNVFSFTPEMSKHKHDDAPDVLAMLLVFSGRVYTKVQVKSARSLDLF